MLYPAVVNLNPDRSKNVLEEAIPPSRKPQLPISFGFDGLKKLIDTIANYQLDPCSRLKETRQSILQEERPSKVVPTKRTLSGSINYSKRRKARIHQSNIRERKMSVRYSHSVLAEIP